MAEPFRILRTRTLVLAEDNIDTDQIIPARFLTTTSREGLGKHAFNDWRWNEDGSAKAESILNQVDPASHRVLVGGHNFGCGSSREHAPWALHDYGFRAVISSKIADIFSANALENGILPITVDAEAHAALLAAPGTPIEIDLEKGTLVAGNHVSCTFTVEPFARQRLLAGVDTLGFLLDRLPAIEAYEERIGA